MFNELDSKNNCDECKFDILFKYYNACYKIKKSELDTLLTSGVKFNQNILDPVVQLNKNLFKYFENVQLDLFKKHLKHHEIDYDTNDKYLLFIKLLDHCST
jgi:hypothetical protein